jgi:hypothetical protein
MAATWPSEAGPLTAEVLTSGDLDVIEHHVEQFETAVSAPFPEPVAADRPVVCADVVEGPPPPLPDVKPRDGDVLAVNDPTLLTFQARYIAASRNPEASQWLAQVLGETMRAGRSLHMQGARTARRMRIMDGLVYLAAANLATFARGAVYTILGEDAVLDKRHSLGAVVSLLDDVQAARFAGLCQDAPELPTEVAA